MGHIFTWMNCSWTISPVYEAQTGFSSTSGMHVFPASCFITNICIVASAREILFPISVWVSLLLTPFSYPLRISLPPPQHFKISEKWRTSVLNFFFFCLWKWIKSCGQFISPAFFLPRNMRQGGVSFITVILALNNMHLFPPWKKSLYGVAPCHVISTLGHHFKLKS